MTAFRLLAVPALCLLAGAALAAEPVLTPAQILEKARAEVTQSLGMKQGTLDVDKPLVEQGADELDLVETIMLLEEVFGVPIPDEKVDAIGADWVKKLTLRHLVNIVIQQRQKKG